MLCKLWIVFFVILSSLNCGKYIICFDGVFVFGVIKNFILILLIMCFLWLNVIVLFGVSKDMWFLDVVLLSFVFIWFNFLCDKWLLYINFVWWIIVFLVKIFLLIVVFIKFLGLISVIFLEVIFFLLIRFVILL